MEPKNQTFSKRNLSKAEETRAHLREPTMSAGDPTPVTSVRAAGKPSCARTESERCFKAATVLKELRGQRGEWEATQTMESSSWRWNVVCLPACRHKTATVDNFPLLNALSQVFFRPPLPGIGGLLQISSTV